MKHILAIALFALTTTAFGQNYHFKPKWKVGDQKEISISELIKEYDDGKLILDTVMINSGRIKVLKEDKECYTLEILFKNQALRSAQTFYEKLGEELKAYNDIKLVYTVNKETAKAKLENWQDAQKFMLESYDKIEAVIAKKVPDAASAAQMMLMPLKIQFKSQETVEAYFSSNISYLLLPFNRDFKVGEAVKTTDSQPNPFNPMQQVSATTIIGLNSVNEGTKTATISQSVQPDLTEFLEMMKSMMRQMSESMGADEKAKAKAEKEIEGLEMSVDNKQITTFNYETGWVTKVVTNGTTTTSDPKKNRKKKSERIITTIVK